MLGACVEFFNDSGCRIDSCDVCDLSSKLLMLGTDAAISINHNITFLSVLNQTVVFSYTDIMSCFRSFGSPFVEKLVQCLQRFLLVPVCSCFCIELVPKVCYAMVVPNLLGGIYYGTEMVLK